MKTVWILGIMAVATASVADIGELMEQAANDKGYAPLFAKDLSNAQLTEKMWQFKGDILQPTPERVTKPLPPKTGKKKPRHPRDIWSTKRYSNFIIDLEFKNAKDTNSGIFIRCGDIANWLQTTMEVQIMQEDGKTPRNSIGSIYDCKAADAKPKLNPVGEWNHYTVIANDNWIHVVLNGKLINSMDLNLWTEVGKNPDGSTNKFKTAYTDMPREGHVGLQYHGQPVWFRNVRIKTL
ncbi:hypothetical protein PDESU_00904 [Pontiella desulfatans]|uniref:3-keto-alpha-glucoside-1,2-lyase/3-keto-2-hydroxy-glucal hydratase domain-containing protein n=1 Tax=Pontiella desulfatans TaxID=2750659 RepID=A0A6C2TXM6_PONDE|nr:DUF1080 domain-containing protein [Pontiella desulfatans]VGO12352.1 hypothetical protein PDESU_00904 [Pontiella desulfatans]